MENQTQITTPTPVAQEPIQQAQPKARHITRNILITLGIVVLGAVGYMAYTNTALFTASITGGSSQAVTTDLYISTDYHAAVGESDYIDVKAGKDLTNLTNPLTITFVAPSSQLDIAGVKTDGTPLSGFTPQTSSATGEFTVSFNTFTAIPAVSKDTVLFKLLVSVKSGVNQGDTIIITSKAGSIKEGATNPPPARVLTFTDGKIIVGTATSLCANVTCGDHGACSQATGSCVCNKGYDPAFLCNACLNNATEHYTGFPDCKVDVLSDITGIVLTFSNDTISKLTYADKKQAYKSVYVIINSSAAAGKKISMLAGGAYTHTIPAYNLPISPAPTELQKINNITDQLASQISSSLYFPGIGVTKLTTAPGILKLTALGANVEDFSGITTDSGDVIIVPALDYTIQLPLPTSSYQMRVIGKKNSDADCSAVELNFNNVKWQPQPVNRVSSSALAGGLLEKGDKGGVTLLYAEIEKANGSKIDSNQITVEVPAGPIVEYIHIIGSNPITKGGRVNLSTKVSDVNLISDIKDIRTSIVRSTKTTYAEISNDANAVWFTATPVIAEVATTNNGTQPAASTTPASGATTGGTPSTPSTPSIPTVAENYRIYSIPVEIPQDANLIDGSYSLLLQITDIAGHVAASVLPINIGSVATGDVNGDGTVNMLDVIAAFQIANGSNANPAQSQLQAADLDKNGKVTMLDVITLFKQLNN